MLSTAEQTALIYDRLKRSGWALGEFAAFNSSDEQGVVYVVCGVCDENAFRVEGNTTLEAWENAESEAKALEIRADGAKLQRGLK